MNSPVSLSVITPNLNSSGWLNLCIASVADQQRVEVEHIIQDALSADLDMPWIAQHPHVRLISERDSGMYDGINCGLARARGEILAHLNADEQYLPGALAAVMQCFREDPQLDVLYADTVVVDRQGECVCCRKSMRPTQLLKFTQFPTITSSLFFHRRVIDEHRLFFDSSYRVVADAVWMRESVTKKLRTAVLRQYTSAFTETGSNLDLSPAAGDESQRLRESNPGWTKTLDVPLQALSRLRRLLHGTYHQKPFSYQIFTLGSPDHRQKFHVEKPSCVWWSRSPRQSGKIHRGLKSWLQPR
jgi:glycosyltransferase involved in cell wall biosynthesis